MKLETNILWKNNMNFISQLGKHTISMDSLPEFGGEDLGVRPKGLLMVALGGCTGMDVVSILKKMKVELDYFNIKIEGNTADEHPKKFLDMKVIYEFKGFNLDYSKLEKAVTLSQEKYCGVKASFEGAIKMSYEIIVL